MAVLTERQRCHRSARRAKVAIGYAVVNSTTPAIGNRLAHIKKKIDELLECIEDEEAANERPRQKPGG